MVNPFANSYLNKSTKIDGENYINWKFMLTTILKADSLWTIVKGDEPKTIVVALIPDWDRREMKEKVLLQMSVKDNIIHHIRDCKTSKEMWDVLKGLYETSNANQILFLKTRLLSIKMEANESIGNFVSIMKYLSDILGDIGEKVSSSDLVTISLKGLVQYYKVFMSALSARQTPPILQ